MREVPLKCSLGLALKLGFKPHHFGERKYPDGYMYIREHNLIMAIDPDAWRMPKAEGKI